MVIIVYVIYYLAVIVAAFSGEKELKLVTFILSILIPDPLPYVDEIILGRITTPVPLL